jgi:hypothetical protein
MVMPMSMILQPTPEASFRTFDRKLARATDFLRAHGEELAEVVALLGDADASQRLDIGRTLARRPEIERIEILHAMAAIRDALIAAPWDLEPPRSWPDLDVAVRWHTARLLELTGGLDAL